VPQRYEHDTALGAWVATQRSLQGNNEIRQYRKDQLNQLGFVWKSEGTDKIWHSQYEKLKEFERKNGHCLVPKGYEQDKSFAL
jgi:hypothetical protein